MSLVCARAIMRFPGKFMTSYAYKWALITLSSHMTFKVNVPYIYKYKILRYKYILEKSSLIFFLFY